MSGASARIRSIRPASLALLLVSATYLGFLSGFPDGVGPVLAAAAVIFATGLRVGARRNVAVYAPVPVLAALVVEVVPAPVGLGTELVAGLAGLSFLLWLADDPSRPAGGSLRSLPTVGIPALAVGIAWSSTLFLPAGAVPLGVAGALLALTLAVVALLVASPTVFDREEA
ncbi:MAG: hypothetical protein ACLPWO_01815 [Thermoplasmata archaeon]